MSARQQHHTSYATSAVTVTAVTGTNTYDGVGGLVGQNYQGSVSQSYATGTVNAGESVVHIGGLVGWNNGAISDSYAMGAVKRRQRQ